MEKVADLGLGITRVTALSVVRLAQTQESVCYDDCFFHVP